MECPEAIDVMGEAVEGSLESAALMAFEEHLDECPSCATYFEQLRLTRAALGHLPPGDTSPRREELIDRFRREFDEHED